GRRAGFAVSLPAVYLVDASVYLFRAWFSMPDDFVNGAGQPTNAVYGFSGFLCNLLEQTGAEHVAVAFDVSLASGFRNEIYPEYKVPPKEWADFLADREGCIIGRTTAEKYGFKVGDRVPIVASIFGGVWEFNVCGIYDGTRTEDDTTQFWFRSDYLEERRTWGKGQVGWYVVRVDNPDDAPAVAEAIDNRFSNSSWETKSETEKAFAAGFVKQVGNIQLLIMVIGSVVFFTLLLVTGNTMALSIRERTGELAVMKTLGFSDRSILWFVLAESQAYAVIGGALGLAGVKLFTLGGDPTGGFLPLFYLAPSRMLLGLMLAMAVGALSGLLPALTARRLRIVEALRRI
ncbi:MAG: ABC transporter permease, partial [Acidobacteriota bacterium]